MKIQNVLIPLALRQDIDERYHTILSFASYHEAKVELLHVIEDLQEEDQVSLSTHNLELLEWVKDEQEKRLTAIANRLTHQFQGLTVTTRVVIGRAFKHIIEIAEQQHADIIVIDANRGYKSLATQYGSTTRHLMRKSPVPVWTLAQDAKKQSLNIAVAVDITVTNEDGVSLNKKLLKSACNIAEGYGAKVTLIHCWTLYGESYFRNWEGKEELDIALLEEQERNQRKALCEKLIEETGVNADVVSIKMIHGSPSEFIPGFMEKHDFDLLVMGTMCRTGIAGFLIGNTAESVLDKLHCSVLTYKPDSFSSPVLE